MKKQRVKNSMATLGAVAFEVTSVLLDACPSFLRVPIVSSLGFVFGCSAKNMREALEDNLHRVLGIPEAQLSSMSNRVFRNFALTLLDFFFPKDVTIVIPDREKLEALRKNNKGILVLTFHMGHWELGARTMQSWGWPVSAVYQPYRNKQFKKVIESRRAPGVHYIPVGGRAAKGVQDALKKGNIVAMLGDHPFGEEGTQVNLLGKRVLWPKGPVVLAMRDQNPIVVAVIIRTGRHHYTAMIEDPLIPQSKTKAEVERLVQAVADKFGKFVSQYPEQWYRFRKFEYTNGV